MPEVVDWLESSVTGNARGEDRLETLWFHGGE